MNQRQAEKELFHLKEELDERLRELRYEYQQRALVLSGHYQPYFDFYLAILHREQEQKSA